MAGGGEAALWRAWAGRLWGGTPLYTTSGQPLQVVYPGRRRGGPGPDFTGAIVVWGPAGRVECGDVEVHPHAAGWQGHGHQGDPAYAGVILHVVLVDDAREPPRRPDGSVVPTLALAPYLPPGALDAALMAGAAAPPAAGPCRVAPGLVGPALLAVLEGAGRERLAAKAAGFEGDLVTVAAGDEGQVLFRGLLDAAGYSRNRAPCRALADRLPVRTLQALCRGRDVAAREALCRAALLGLAGLLPEGDAGTPAWEETRALWLGPPLHRGDWHRAAVRPANRPEARLQAMAALVARTVDGGLLAGLLAPLREGAAAGTPPRKVAAGLGAALTVPGGPDGGLGTARAREMLINVVLPFAVAWGNVRSDTALADTAAAVLAVLPGSPLNETLAAMQEVLDPAGCAVERLSALQQQGVLHLHARHCSLRDCPSCPLAHPPAALTTTLP